MVVQFAIFLLVGLALWAYYDHALPADLGLTRDDEIFPLFIIEGLPTGISGLLLAGILAAAMSTLSSSLSALSSSTVNDVYAKLKRTPMTDEQGFKVGRWATIGWGIAFILPATVFESDSGNIVILALGIAGITYGGLLGAFVFGIVNKRARALDANIAFALAVFAVVGRSLPASLRVFLLTLAIVDDLGAIALIAILFSQGVQWVPLLAALGVMPIEGLAIIGAATVLATRCLDVEDAYKAVDWKILSLIFGMLAISVAMDKVGLVELIVSSVVTLTPWAGPLFMLSFIYLFTSTLTEVLSNNAVAVLVTPIAIGLAQQLGVDPRAFVVAVMFAASASFATPIGYQTNTFVYTAGGYRFSDFLKVGIPLNLLLWGAATLVIPWFWPLAPV